MKHAGTYVAAEPEMMNAFIDQRGMLHRTRDDAIAANVESDLLKMVDGLCAKHFTTYQGLPVKAAVTLLRQMADEHPDMLRVLIGQRDAT